MFSFMHTASCVFNNKYNYLTVNSYFTKAKKISIYIYIFDMRERRELFRQSFFIGEQSASNGNVTVNIGEIDSCFFKRCDGLDIR